MAQNAPKSVLLGTFAVFFMEDTLGHPAVIVYNGTCSP